MKILLIANSGLFLEKFKTELIETLSMDYELTVAPRIESNQLEQSDLSRVSFQDYRITRRSVNPLKELFTFIDLLRLVRTTEADLLITFTIKPNLYVAIISKMLKVRNIRVVTGLGKAFNSGKPSELFFKFLYKITSSYDSIIIFENKTIMEYFRKNNIGSNHICLNGSGVNLKQFQFRPYPVNDKIRLLFVGRIMKEKGVLELITACKSLISKGFNFNLRLVGSVEESFDFSNLGEWFEFLGYKDSVMDEYISCNALILPSYHEGLPNVVLEAGAIGRPSLVSDIPGCNDVIEDGYNGLLFKAKDAESLENIINDFLKMSPIRREQMGINARKKVEQVYDRQVVNSQYLNIIENSFLNVR